MLSWQRGNLIEHGCGIGWHCDSKRSASDFKGQLPDSARHIEYDHKGSQVNNGS